MSRCKLRLFAALVRLDLDYVSERHAPNARERCLHTHAPRAFRVSHAPSLETFIERLFWLAARRQQVRKTDNTNEVLFLN
jgi:hypothetical protein